MLATSLFFLTTIQFLPTFTRAAAAASSCVTSCFGTHLQYPFGFSPGCHVPLTCSPSGQALIGEFPVSAIDNSTIKISINPSCARPIAALKSLFATNYAPKASNSILLHNCSSVRACSIPATSYLTDLGLVNCSRPGTSGSLSCFSDSVTWNGLLDYDNMTRHTDCYYLMSSVSVQYGVPGDRTSGVSLEVQMMELEWWMDGADCDTCSDDAECQRVNTTDRRRPGYRCNCRQGFSGDGYRDGVGCRKELQWTSPPHMPSSIRANEKKLLAVVLASVGAAAIIVAASIVYWLMKRKGKGDRAGSNHTILKTGFQTQTEDLSEDKDPSVPIFDVLDIFAATDNFSMANKLGQGGFGSVYKGTLSGGQEIAVKRLSQTSRQGIREFKNEVRLVSKLQHKNLTRIFGCCIHGEDKMLVYEYLPNRSLDFFIFDKTKGLLLGWMRRFKIIIGVARGLLYLHQDSRLKIIHRDLKASNVLLDGSMNPKISDFGLARLFGEDQIEANTDRVVGTYGYMSPEYAMEGLYSTKSDVFSFGVLTLEIVSSTRSNQCYQASSSSSLIGHVWDLWSEGRALDMVDSSTMGESFSTDQVMRCIQIGLLCVQEFPIDRPAMSDVVFMLGNATTLPSPKKPAFVLNKRYDDADPATSTTTGSSGVPSTNRVSITTLVAR